MAFFFDEKAQPKNVPDPQLAIYCLQHIETKEFVCLLVNGTDRLACFSSGDAALEFRSEQKLQEFVDVVATTFEKSPFSHFWFDGQLLVLRD